MSITSWNSIRDFDPLRSVLQVIPDYIWLKDNEGVYLACNHAVAWLLGAKENDIIGKTDYDFLDEELANTFRQKHKEALSAKNGLLHEEWVTRKEDGKLILLEIQKTQVHDLNGEIIGILSIGRDITERKQRDEQLQLLNHAFNQVNEAIFLTGEDGLFSHVNEKACSSLGYTREELLGMSVFDIDPNVTPEIFEHAKVSPEREFAILESHHKTKDGRIFPIEVSASHIVYQGKNYGMALVRDITERKAIERQLALLNYAIDQVGESIWLIDKDANIHYVNQAACLSTGYTHEEILQLRIPDIGADFPLEMWYEHWKELKEKKSLRFEVDHKTKDGKVFLTEVNANYFEFDGEGYNLALSHDISQRKRLEQELAAREQQFRALAESLPSPVFRFDKNCYRVYMNPIAEKIIGKTAEELLYKKASDSSPMNEEELKKAEKAIECVLQTGKQIEEDVLFKVPATGEIYYFHNIYAPEFDVNGDVAGVISISHNITDRKRMEEKIRQREQEFRILVETSTSPIFRYDQNCRLTYVNPAAEKMMGRSAAELLEYAASEDSILNKYGEEELKGILQHVLKTGEVAENEVSYIFADGELYYFHNRYAPELDENGNPVGVVLVSHDVTERKQMEDKLRLREQEFRVLVETSPSPIIRYDENCRRVYVNPAVEKISGKCAAELLDIPPSSGSLKNGVQTEIEQLLQQVLRTGQPTENEVELIFPDGRTHYFFNRYAPELDWSGKPVGVVLVGHDITLRKQAENLLLQREQEFRTLVDNLPTIVIRYNLKLHRVYANQAYLQITQHSLEELFNISIEKTWLATNLSAQDYCEILKQVIATGTQKEILLEWTDKNGQSMLYEVKIVPEYDLDGNVQGLLALGIDVTARYVQMRVENNRQQVFEKISHNENLDVVLTQVALYVESSKAGRYCAILVVDETEQELQIIAAPSLPESYIVKNGSSFLEIKHENCTGWLTSVLIKERVVLENLSQHPCYAFCKGFVHEIDAKACWAEPILSASNELLGVVTIYLNQTGAPDENDSALLRQAAHLSAIAIERKRIERKMSYQASYDALTGLPNRHLFNNRLRVELLRTERSASQLALLFIDLDHFKEVNDTLGHDTGDKLLIEAANRIQHCVRESDTVARLGGDEFVVILPDAGQIPPLERIAEDIIKIMVKPFHFGEYIAYVSASIGIAVYPQDADNTVTLMSCADQAMYSAKELGRNSFCFFTPSMQEQAHQRLYLINSLRRALEKNELEMYYQPIVDVKTGKVTKAEALIRWTHANLGAISPAIFIPLAEETNLIQEIGSWIFCQAADMAKRWNLHFNDNLSRKISINMSPRQLTKGNGEQIAVDYLKKIELDSRHVVIEITEGLLLDNSPEIVSKLAQLRAAGIELSLDDFGTGYSAISYLKKFNLDYLKIDRSFVKDLETDDSDRAITEAIVAMAHRLGLKVIAEGVETDGQRALLAAVGCEFIQGYFYSKPLPAEAFLAFAA